MSLNLPEGVLVHLNAPYDPQKRHQYYEDHKHLKGRKPGAAKPGGGGKVVPIRGSHVSVGNQAASEARVAAIRTRLTALRDALHKALAEAEKKSSSSSKTSTASKSKATSSKPETAKQKADARAASKKYRDTHKQQIAAKRKTIADMTVTELRAAIQTAEANLRAVVQQARSQTASNGR